MPVNPRQCPDAVKPRTGVQPDRSDTSESLSSLGVAALSYARRGWSVFPLSRTKAPAFPTAHPQGDPLRGRCKGGCGRLGHGFHDATFELDVIAGWWTAAPSRNIGGRVPARLLVLDIDPRGGGDDTLARLEAEHGPLPETLTCYSGRSDGGRHLYFARPPGKLTGTRLRPGIDLVHHGLRYVVLPPSVHPAIGQPYRWADPSRPAAQPPAWLVARLRPNSRPRGISPFVSPGAVGDGAALARFVAGHSAKEGSGRHDAVLWALCRAYETGAEERVIAEIKAAAERIGKPPGEVEAMAAWAETHTGGGR